MVELEIINNSKNEIPNYKNISDSGMDVRTNIEAPITLKPLERYLFPTGLCIDIPDGYEIQVRPRSGLAAKHGLTVLNTPGTIDSGYKDEIKVIIINLSNEEYTVEPGERIAQLVLAKVEKGTFKEVSVFTNMSNDRGGGIGHTGKF